MPFKGVVESKDVTVRLGDLEIRAFNLESVKGLFREVELFEY